MRIHITNLPKRITDKDLHEMALAYGKPDSAIVARKITGGESKGFGFIEYFNPDEARAAVAALNGKVIDGQAIKVAETNATRPNRRSSGART